MNGRNGGLTSLVLLLLSGCASSPCSPFHHRATNHTADPDPARQGATGWRRSRACARRGEEVAVSPLRDCWPPAIAMMAQRRAASTAASPTCSHRQLTPPCRAAPTKPKTREIKERKLRRGDLVFFGLAAGT